MCFASFERSLILQFPHSVTFDWLFVSSNEEQLQEEARRRFLVDAACPATASESSLKKIVCQIEHTLSVAVRSDRLTAAILELLNDILVRSQGIIGTEWASLKAYVFTQCPSIRALSTAPTLSVGVWEGTRMQQFDISYQFTINV